MGCNYIIPIVELDSKLKKYLPKELTCGMVYQSSGLKKHVMKRHSDCEKYLEFLPEIIMQPDFIGVNPNEKVASFELVKKIGENLQLGIKLDKKDGYLYVATLHKITDGKIKHRLVSGRLKKIDNFE